MSSIFSLNRQASALRYSSFTSSRLAMRGQTRGPQGEAATITIGTVTTLNPGESATVTNSGTTGAAVLNFGIPEGDPGQDGEMTGPGASIDSEIALYNGTDGATLKRASTTGVLKATSGVLAAAVSGTDYAPATSGTAILKGSGSGGFSSASAGTDYVAPGGALGTPSSGTLTNCTGLPVAGITASTSTAISVGSIELGHATDTTLSRSASGVLAVEGVDLTANIVQNSQSTAYTAVIGDANKHILHPAADNNARTFTIPANASVAYPIGTTLTFINEINTVTIAITSDTLTLAGAGSTGSRTLAANGMATAIKITSTKWMISGTGLT